MRAYRRYDRSQTEHTRTSKILNWLLSFSLYKGNIKLDSLGNNVNVADVECT